MSETTMKIPAAKRRRTIDIRRFMMPLVVALGGVLAFILLNAVINGKCDSTCVIDTLNQTLRLATPVALAAYCGLLCERAAVINIGIEGMMLMGAMVAYGVNVFAFVWLQSMGWDKATAGTTAHWLALLMAVACSGLLALLHGVVSIRFKADQIISGTVINILALGVTGYVYRQYLAQNIPTGPGTFPPFSIPLLSAIPVIGPIFFTGHTPLVYLMLLLTLVIHFVLFYTPWGLRTQAVGENPRAADTLGINVYKVRYINVLLGGFVAGLGGAWFTLAAADTFTINMTNGRGFIGLAAMIFGNWTPLGSLFGAIVFGLGDSITTTLGIFRPDIPSQIPPMLPYVLTMIVLAGLIGRVTAPAADGQPYEKQ